ncbi:MAG: AAA family ATPase, partial [Acetobacteraceae bacterium]
MDQRLMDQLTRIAAAMERLAPPPPAPLDLGAAEAFVWHPDPPHLVAVAHVSRVDIELLKGVERQKQ